MTRAWKIVCGVVVPLVVIAGIGFFNYQMSQENEVKDLKKAMAIIELPPGWKLVDERYTPTQLFCGDVTCSSAFQRYRSDQSLESALTQVTKNLHTANLDDCNSYLKSHSFCTIKYSTNGFTFTINLQGDTTSKNSEISINAIKD